MKRPTKRFLVWTVARTAVILMLLACGVIWFLYHSVSQTAAEMYEEVASTSPVYMSKDIEVKVAKEQVQMNSLAPFTVLVLGVDQREHDRGRSDTMIVLSVNPAKQSILMFNIPRDTRTDIIGHGTVDKINHAYAFGGVEMSIRTVEHFLDYPINYYVKVNMESFAQLIDLIGGVEVNNPFAFDYEGHKFEQGRLVLNGTDALKFARMRYDDPRGDLGRNSRQHDILKEIMKKSTSISNVTRLHSLLGELGDCVKTNLTFDDMKQLATDYRPQLHKIDTIEIQGKGKMIDRIWYYIVDNSERIRIHNLLKEHVQKVPANAR
ncbi:LCP family glycopolymer transferase [Paenibacillus silvisoli]|uniref:LCP family glycopolymer transferase n=1 Tax=Paenibacillus silvisoli TaxID=3110539 RepID=UPI002803E036|nr:LCP family protein [Paenibacillus silvisoli]